MISVFICIFLFVVFLIFIQPLLTLYISWRSTNFSEDYLSQNLPYSTDMSGFEGLPDFKKGDQLIGKATNAETCENGFYIGYKEMVNIDCTKICNATSSKQFTYKYINSNNIIVNNQYLRKGGWCLPTSLVRCNLNISIAVKALGRYECVSKYPKLLGGPYGNDIVGCAPIYEFRDNLKKLIYTHNAPSTLVISDLDEKINNSTDQYRFECNAGSSEHRQFSTFESRPDLGNRFQLYYDSCSFFDEGGKMVNDKCECSHERRNKIIKPLTGDLENVPESICSTCTSGYEIIDEKNPQYGSKYGVSIGVDCVDPEHIEYYKTMSIVSNGILPCGMKTLLNIRENSNQLNYGCHRALINVTNSYTPEMLERING